MKVYNKAGKYIAVMEEDEELLVVSPLEEKKLVDGNTMALFVNNEGQIENSECSENDVIFTECVTFVEQYKKVYDFLTKMVDEKNKENDIINAKTENKGNIIDDYLKVVTNCHLTLTNPGFEVTFELGVYNHSTILIEGPKFHLPVDARPDGLSGENMVAVRFVAAHMIDYYIEQNNMDKVEMSSYGEILDEGYNLRGREFRFDSIRIDTVKQIIERRRNGIDTADILLEAGHELIEAECNLPKDFAEIKKNNNKNYQYILKMKK